MPYKRFLISSAQRVFSAATARRGGVVLSATVIVGALTLTGCSAPDHTSTKDQTNAANNSASEETSQRHVLAVDAPVVENSADSVGIKTAQEFFPVNDSSYSDLDEVVVVAAGEPFVPAARYAISAGIPIFRIPAPNTAPEQSANLWAEDIAAFIAARKITTVTGFGLTPEQMSELSAIPGVSVEALAEASAVPSAEGSTEASAVPAAAVAPASDAERRTVAQIESPRDGAVDAPQILVAPGTTAPQIACARAAGLPVEVLPVADPRASAVSMAAVVQGNVRAVGAGFAEPELFERQVALAHHGELPGGGGLVFPGRRMVALYGHPSGPALGVLGEQAPEAAVARAQQWAAQYQKLTQWPVIPAFEIIATVASDAPGDDGNYSNETDPAELAPYVDAIVNAGGYAVLDLQPGRASLLEQARRYEELLRRPNVGLALDPEWKIGPNEVPMTDIGHVDAEEINEVSQWLAGVVNRSKLPQKALIIHQFQGQMVRNREQINTSYPELAFVLHADGHGDAGQKLDTWEAVRQGLSPDFFMAWKNFIDEDTPMFNPVQTYDVNPRPWFVSYQ